MTVKLIGHGKPPAVVADMLFNSFEWQTSPEGYKYWEEVYRKLHALTAGGYDPAKNAPSGVSSGSSHRCIDCSLLRCSAPDTRCVECDRNIKGGI